MPLAYKLLSRDGYSLKSGKTSWPLPKLDAPGDWITNVLGQGKYHLCTRTNILLWIDHQIFVAEFKKIIEKNYDDIVVPDARLIRKIESWNDGSQGDFMQKCYEYIVANKEYISNDLEKLANRCSAGDIFSFVKLAGSFLSSDDEFNWQNDLLWGYIQAEIMDNFPQDQFV